MISRFRITAEELRQAVKKLFGDTPGWQTRLAERLGVDRSAITRWLAGATPVPLYASLLIHYMLKFGVPEKALRKKHDL
ncbi:MAG: helix-turn-helix domain-containing protein [Oceanicaulis sp.]|nr:helix-turn-helix domain-containing protein [Oceanicaulis sp.]